MDARTKTSLGVIALLVNMMGVVGGGLYTYFTIQGNIKESLARFETEIKSVNEKVTENSKKIDDLSESDLINNDDFEKRLNTQAPWRNEGPKVIYRIDLLEKSNKKLAEKIEQFEKQQSKMLTKLDMLLKRK